jgi:hypothetical protein
VTELDIGSCGKHGFLSSLGEFSTLLCATRYNGSRTLVAPDRASLTSTTISPRLKSVSNPSKSSKKRNPSRRRAVLLCVSLSS